MTILAHYIKTFSSMVFVSLFLMGCVGTGTRNFSSIQRIVDDSSATAVIVLRDTGFGGLAALMDINLNGLTIVTLGNQEMTAHLVEPGNHVIQAAFTGIGGLGLNKPISNFEIEEGDKKYFLVQLPSNGSVFGLPDYTVTLLEVTRRGFFAPR